MCHTQRSLGVLSCWVRQGKDTPGGKGDFQPHRGTVTPGRKLYPYWPEKEKERSAGVRLQREGGTQILGPQGYNALQGAQSTRSTICCTHPLPGAH